MVALVCEGSVVAVATDGLEPISPSTRAQARGGADVAVGDSALSQIDNPSTLTLSPRDAYRFDLGGQVILASSRWTGPIDAAESEIRLIPLANMAVAMPVDERLTLGLALQSKAGLASRYRVRHLLIPFVQRRIGSDVKDVGFSINAGYKLTERLSVGVGVRGEVVAAEFSTVLGPADLEFGRGYACGGGFQLGLHYQARDDLAFGLGYRSPTWFGDLAGGDAKASLFGFLPIGLGHANLDECRLPQKVAAGAAWDAMDWLKLIGEIRWVNYSNSTFHSTTIATDGLVDLRYPFPLGYRDQWVFITGAEFKLDEFWTLGAGYHYCTNPVPRTNVCPVASVIAQHHLTVGLRYEKDNWWIGGGYILAFPASLRGGGHSDVPLGVDYGFSTLEQTQHSIVVGFGFSW